MDPLDWLKSGANSAKLAHREEALGKLNHFDLKQTRAPFLGKQTVGGNREKHTEGFSDLRGEKGPIFYDCLKLV